MKKIGNFTIALWGYSYCDLLNSSYITTMQNWKENVPDNCSYKNPL